MFGVLFTKYKLTVFEVDANILIKSNLFIRFDLYLLGKELHSNQGVSMRYKQFE